MLLCMPNPSDDSVLVDANDIMLGFVFIDEVCML